MFIIFFALPLFTLQSDGHSCLTLQNYLTFLITISLFRPLKNVIPFLRHVPQSRADFWPGVKDGIILI